VTWLAPAGELPEVHERILVAGTSGSGKSTLARQIAAALRLPYFELDALFHGPGWTERETFELDVTAHVARPAWVTEYQYAKVRPRLAARAQLLVWLDLPRPVVMRRVVRRTVVRRLSRIPVCNGNLEPPLTRFFTDPDHIVRWSWRTHAGTAQVVAECREQRPGLPIVRLRSQAEVDAWRAGPLAAAGG
jgi:adenylate kinase family enzyme